MRNTNVLARTGLTLPQKVLRTLRQAGIFAQPSVTLHYQELARRYILRGLESGGASGDTGRYVTFADDEGRPLECLHAVESFTANGTHAVAIAPVLVRADMVRKGQTYELLVTRHSLVPAEHGPRPTLVNQALFRGVHGRIELDLTTGNKNKTGDIVPTFYSLAGEAVTLPALVLAMVQAATRGANCLHCSHLHYLQRPKPASMPLTNSGKRNKRNTPRAISPVSTLPTTEHAGPNHNDAASSPTPHEVILP